MSDKRHVQPVRLSPELFNAITTLAAQERRPVAQMARVLIEDAVAARAEATRKKLLKESALEAVRNYKVQSVAPKARARSAR